MISESKKHSPLFHKEYGVHNTDMIHSDNNNDWVSLHVYDDIRCNQRGSFYWIVGIRLVA